MNIPDHLGGHLNRTWTDIGALQYLKKNFNILSMIDLGCGPGGMKEIANNLGITWHGVDGDPSFKDTPNYTIVDFTKEKYSPTQRYDLCWSVEFLEHVEEQYIENYLPVILSAKYFLCTASDNPKGHHHVNVKSQQYWIDLFAYNGLIYDKEETERIKSHSTMKAKGGKPSFLQQTGMFFRK